MVARLEGKLFLASSFSSSFPHRYKRTSVVFFVSHGHNVVNHGWPAQYDRWAGLMLRPDASLVEDLLRESPADRKLKFLNGSSRWRMRSFTLDEHETPFFHQLHFLRLPTSVPQRIHEDPADCPSIPAAHWNPFPVISFAICIRDDS